MDGKEWELPAVGVFTWMQVLGGRWGKALDMGRWVGCGSLRMLVDG